MSLSGESIFHIGVLVAVSSRSLSRLRRINQNLLLLNVSRLLLKDPCSGVVWTAVIVSSLLIELFALVVIIRVRETDRLNNGVSRFSLGVDKHGYGNRGNNQMV